MSVTEQPSYTQALEARATRHAIEAERLLEKWHRSSAGLPEDLAAAQVHATLALAARTEEAAYYVASLA